MSGEIEGPYNKGNKGDNGEKTERFRNNTDIGINQYGNYMLKLKR